MAPWIAARLCIASSPGELPEEVDFVPVEEGAHPGEKRCTLAGRVARARAMFEALAIHALRTTEAIPGVIRLVGQWNTLLHNLVFSPERLFRASAGRVNFTRTGRSSMRMNARR